MDTKKITLISAFGALSIVLNAFTIPTVYLPGFYYKLDEVPIVVAFLLFGPKIGFSVTGLRLLGQLVFFFIPAGLVAYPFGVIAISLMMLGVYLANMLVKRRFPTLSGVKEGRIVLYLTVLGVAVRGAIMPLLDFSVLYHVLFPLTLGRTLPEAYVVGLLPGMFVYNITVPLYTIPISYFVTKRVKKIFKFNSSKENNPKPDFS